MSKQNTPEEVEMGYLLGTVSEEEKVRLEENFFADDYKFEELEIAEEDLIDRYVRNELDTETRTSFERRLAHAPRLQERVEFARLLATRIGAMSPAIQYQPVSPSPRTSDRSSWGIPFISTGSARPAPRWALAACVVILIVALSALILGGIKLRNETGRIEAERLAMDQQKRDLEKQVSDERSRNTQLATDLQSEKNLAADQEKTITELQKQLNSRPGAASTIAFLNLFTGSLRTSGSGNAVTIKPETAQLRLKIAFDSVAHESYNAVVQTPEGGVVYEQAGLAAHGKGSRKSVFLLIPASRLSAGDYVVNVQGVSSTGASESVAKYSFQVKKRL